MNVSHARTEFVAPIEAGGPLAPSVEKLRLRAYLGIMAGDILAMLAGFTLAGLVYTGVLFESRAMMEAL